jgi:hypothetical protein
MGKMGNATAEDGMATGEVSEAVAVATFWELVALACELLHEESRRYLERAALGNRAGRWTRAEDNKSQAARLRATAIALEGISRKVAEPDAVA